MEKKTKTLELCEWCAAVVGDAYPLRQISRYRTVECEYCGKKRQGGTYEMDLKPKGKG